MPKAAAILAKHSRKNGEIQMPQAEQSVKIPAEISKELRTLAHDLSNSIETIMQACYLLNQSKLDETSKKWAEMIDQGARDAAKINREIRDILRSRS
jgi:signal transduction histidine kinase